MARPDEVGKVLEKMPEVTSLEKMIFAASKEIGKSVPDQIKPERIIQIALTCVRTNPDLAKCTPASFLGALFVSAELGLEPIAGNAYIIPFNNKRKINGNWQTIKEAQFIIGYRGLASLFYRHAKSLGLSWGVVYEGDTFDYQYGTDQYLRHKPGESKDKVIGYYVIASLRGGDKPFLYMTKEACLAHGEKHSKTFNNGKFHDSSPWAKEFDAMAKKTVLIQLAKTLPLSVELHQAIQSDETSREYREGVGSAFDIKPEPWGDDVVEIEEADHQENNPAPVCNELVSTARDYYIQLQDAKGKSLAIGFYNHAKQKAGLESYVSIETGTPEQITKVIDLLKIKIEETK